MKPWMRVPVARGAALVAILAAPALAQNSFDEAMRLSPAPRQTQAPQPPQSRPQPGPPTGPPRPAAGATPPAADSRPDQQMKEERQDFGVPATQQLHDGAMHGPTPATIPGGQVVTTKGLSALVQGRQVPFLLLDVLGGPELLPGALPAAWASQPGSFDDAVQQRYRQALEGATKGNKAMPVVVYCLSTHCWMSYNAALRAIHLGYTNVLWYRGGIEAWKSAGLPTTRAQQQGNPQ